MRGAYASESSEKRLSIPVREYRLGFRSQDRRCSPVVHNAWSSRTLHLLDSSENGLADLARDLAANRSLSSETRLRISFADITSPLLTRAIEAEDSPDLVLHLAAAKHVRSERDVVSALRILDVNVYGTSRLLEALATLPKPPRVFAVSTDKAVRPTSMMGASKALMESLLWDYPGKATSTRFANVLFSTGSITESWVNRLATRDPLSSPLDTLRYFVSSREAGRLCTHAIAAPPGTVTIPSSESVTLTDLTELAERLLGEFKLKAERLSMRQWEEASRPTSVDAYLPTSYPLVCTPRDTSGEKECEEFRDPLETATALSPGLLSLSEPHTVDVQGVLDQLSVWRSRPSTAVALPEVGQLLSGSLPTYTGVASGLKGLDTRI